MDGSRRIVKGGPVARSGAATTVAAGLILALAGCGSSSAAAVAHVGDLQIIHPFLPQPASPSVASVYLTVRNTGAVADELVSVSTPAAANSMLMTENPDGTMASLVDLAIPAHGEASLVPGHDHVMLENPTTDFKVGQDVSVTLRFAHAGALAVEVPVVPLSDIVDDGNPTSATTDMKGMKGM